MIYMYEGRERNRQKCKSPHVSSLLFPSHVLIVSCSFHSLLCVHHQIGWGSHFSPPPSPYTIGPPGFGFHPKFLSVYKPYSKMKRMFSKKGLVESSKDEKIEDVESDADLQE